jgi:glycerol-3-phosphate dehydrogenase (NAD(P)+)
MKTGVLGAGGWGTALSLILLENGHEVILWTHDSSTKKEIEKYRENKTYLPGIRIPSELNITNDSSLIGEAEIVVNAVPTQFIRGVIHDFKIPLENKQIINGSKGIERNSLKRISEIFYECANVTADNYAVISGPSHAEEVTRKSPTNVVAASEDIFLDKQVQKLFTRPEFRVYTSNDVVGAEIGGSLKNVIAIAAGIIDGLELGDNTKAALITRGLAEISRLGIAIGANNLTFAGLSGLGDLIVTCGSKHSRNRKVGELLGQGKKPDEIINTMKMVAEGIHTTESAFNLGKKHAVELPITEQIYNILFNDIPPREAMSNLMNRSAKREWWW